MQILLVILSLVLLIYLCFKGVPIFFGAMISGIFLLITAGMNPVEQITTTYVTGLANYFGKFFFISHFKMVCPFGLFSAFMYEFHFVIFLSFTCQILFAKTAGWIFQSHHATIPSVFRKKSGGLSLC